jgi:hypothetical protein
MSAFTANTTPMVVCQRGQNVLTHDQLEEIKAKYLSKINDNIAISKGIENKAQTRFQTRANAQLAAQTRAQTETAITKLPKNSDNTVSILKKRQVCEISEIKKSISLFISAHGSEGIIGETNTADRHQYLINSFNILTLGIVDFSRKEFLKNVHIAYAIGGDANTNNKMTYSGSNIDILKDAFNYLHPSPPPPPPPPPSVFAFADAVTNANAPIQSLSSSRFDIEIVKSIYNDNKKGKNYADLFTEARLWLRFAMIEIWTEDHNYIGDIVHKMGLLIIERYKLWLKIKNDLTQKTMFSDVIKKILGNNELTEEAINTYDIFYIPNSADTPDIKENIKGTERFFDLLYETKQTDYIPENMIDDIKKKTYTNINPLFLNYLSKPLGNGQTNGEKIIQKHIASIASANPVPQYFNYYLNCYEDRSYKTTPQIWTHFKCTCKTVDRIYQLYPGPDENVRTDCDYGIHILGELIASIQSSSITNPVLRNLQYNQYAGAQPVPIDATNDEMQKILEFFLNSATTVEQITFISEIFTRILLNDDIRLSEILALFYAIGYNEVYIFDPACRPTSSEMDGIITDLPGQVKPASEPIATQEDKCLICGGKKSRRKYKNKSRKRKSRKYKRKSRKYKRKSRKTNNKSKKRNNKY